MLRSRHGEKTRSGHTADVEIIGKKVCNVIGTATEERRVRKRPLEREQQKAFQRRERCHRSKKLRECISE